MVVCRAIERWLMCQTARQFRAVLIFGGALAWISADPPCHVSARAYLEQNPQRLRAHQCGSYIPQAVIEAREVKYSGALSTSNGLLIRMDRLADDKIKRGGS